MLPLPFEGILPLDHESEEKRKNVATKRKKYSTRMKLAFAGVVFLIMLISPQGLQIFANFAQSKAVKSPFFMKILQTSSDVLWSYGYLEESFGYYKFIYDNVSEANNLKLVQDSFYNMALTQYYMGQYRTALSFYEIYKKRWPDSDPERLNLIDKRIKIISGINPNW